MASSFLIIGLCVIILTLDKQPSMCYSDGFTAIKDIMQNKEDHLPYVTFVCTGNICRSPMAEKLLEAALQKDAELKDRFCVVSAGTGAYDGGPASQHSVDAVAERGLDLSTHRSQRMTRTLMDRSVAVFCMTEGHRRQLRQAFPESTTPLLLIGELMAEGAMKEIGDPFGSNFPTYSASRDAIETAIPSIVAFLRRHVSPQKVTLSLGCDHAAIELKNGLVDYLKDNGYTVLDRGTHSDASVDYPDFAQKVSKDVSSGVAQYGILACKTGIGISISANKLPGIRAAVVHNALDAKLCREHNDANVICFGGAHETPEIAQQYLNIFLKTRFCGGRHARRVEKIQELENHGAAHAATSPLL